jgi:hypothetical protein
LHRYNVRPLRIRRLGVNGVKLSCRPSKDRAVSQYLSDVMRPSLVYRERIMMMGLIEGTSEQQPSQPRLSISAVRKANINP